MEGTGSPAPSHLLPQPGTPSRGYSLGRVLGVGWLLHSHRPFLTFPGKGEILHLITQSWGQVIVGLQLQIIILKKKTLLGFPGGSMVKNLPCNAWHTGSIPGLGRSHMPCRAAKPMSCNYWAHTQQLRKPECSRARAPQQQKLPQRE